jgi:hypothetical protein
MGFSNNLQQYIKNNFQYDNLIHKGLLLGLLLNDEYYLLSPFIPLQNYPDQDKKIQKITQEWEKEIINILKKTQFLDKKGGNFLYKKTKKGKKTKKTKKTRKSNKK